jgi:uncharacterized protein (TIGR04255 family)
MGVYFSSPILAMRAEHIGLFWAQIADVFPEVSQTIPLGNIDVQVEGEIFPLPRFWFIAEDNVYLLQVQRNAFILNWRKQESEYPHYEQVKSTFDRYFALFGEFCEKKLLGDLNIARCELNYINIIETSPKHFNSYMDTDRIVPSYSPLTIERDRSPRAFSLTYEYPIASDLTLTVIMQTRKTQKTNEDILYLELRTAGGLQAQTASARDGWFERAHDAIGSAFNSLTSEKMQKEHWQFVTEEGQ